jgi:hypothetical protein
MDVVVVVLRPNLKYDLADNITCQLSVRPSAKLKHTYPGIGALTFISPSLVVDIGGGCADRG